MSLRIVTTGSGPDVALLHGWGLGAGVWEATAALLAETCRVHVVSLAGYDDHPADDLDFSATAATLADQLPAGCTLCGWSLGGMLALSAAPPRALCRIWTGRTHRHRHCSTVFVGPWRVMPRQH
jgi:pimeloyl-[acyl-carrier protein] methyl ester esterase